MTCFHPLLAERISPRSSKYNPKKKIKIYSNNDISVDLPQRESSRLSDFFYVPCGRCIGCRIDKARDWAVRIMCESYTSQSAWFLTLTYDNDHMDSFSLYKEHLQDFIKKVRDKVRNYNNAIRVRYFGCGEYGDKSGRRHYHLIMWNLPNLLIEPKAISTSHGNILYSSELLNMIWEKGFVVLGSVSPESAQYVARYTLKKQGLKDYTDLDLEAPFLLMSTRPGIGYDYCFENRQKLTLDWKILIGHDYAHIPRYFMRILEDDPFVGLRVVQHKEELKDLSFDKKFAKVFLNNKSFKDLLTSEELNLLKEQEEHERDNF